MSIYLGDQEDSSPPFAKHVLSIAKKGGTGGVDEEAVPESESRAANPS